MDSRRVGRSWCVVSRIHLAKNICSKRAKLSCDYLNDFPAIISSVVRQRNSQYQLVNGWLEDSSLSAAATQATKLVGMALVRLAMRPASPSGQFLSEALLISLFLRLYVF